MISMQQEKQRAKVRRSARRAVTALAVAAGLMAGGGTALAAENAPPPEPGGAAAVAAIPTATATPAAKPGFFETYRGRTIMGWGTGESACAYIDGNRLVVFPAPDGAYTSSLQGYQPERNLRLITKASVRALGDLDMSPTTELKTDCPVFKVTVVKDKKKPPAEKP